MNKLALVTSNPKSVVFVVADRDWKAQRWEHIKNMTDEQLLVQVPDVPLTQDEIDKRSKPEPRYLKSESRHNWRRHKQCIIYMRECRSGGALRDNPSRRLTEEEIAHNENRYR